MVKSAVNINYAHKTPVGWITMVMFLIVALACGDVIGAAIIFIGLCVSLVILAPLATLIGYICVRCGMKTGPRRALMLIPVLALSLFVFFYTNAFGGYQRALLHESMEGHLPAGTQIVAYAGDSGMMGEHCTISIRCDPASLRQILQASPFVGVTDIYQAQMLQRQPVPGLHPSTAPSEWLVYKRGDWKVLPDAFRKCDIVTDASYSWASIHYDAGH